MNMMALAQSNVATCRVRNTAESYRYYDLELEMDQTKALKKGNGTSEFVAFHIFFVPLILGFCFIIIEKVTTTGFLIGFIF